MSSSNTSAETPNIETRVTALSEDYKYDRIAEIEYITGLKTIIRELDAKNHLLQIQVTGMRAELREQSIAETPEEGVYQYLKSINEHDTLKFSYSINEIRDAFKAGRASLEMENAELKKRLSTMYDGFSKSVLAVKDQQETIKRYKKSLELIQVMALLKPSDERNCEIWTEAKSALEGTNE